MFRLSHANAILAAYHAQPYELRDPLFTGNILREGSGLPWWRIVSIHLLSRRSGDLESQSIMNVKLDRLEVSILVHPSYDFVLCMANGKALPAQVRKEIA